MGKRKIAIEKIDSKSKRQVTFSKRRQGLFKKASDLCILTNAQIAIIVFSPAGKVYTFGHSSVEAVVNHFRNGTVPNTDHSTLLNQIRENEVKTELVQQKEQLQQEEEEVSFWWETIKEEDINDLAKLESIKNRMDNLRENLMKRLELESCRSYGNVNETFKTYPPCLNNGDGVAMTMIDNGDISALSVVDYQSPLPLDEEMVRLLSDPEFDLPPSMGDIYGVSEITCSVSGINGQNS